MGAPVYRLADLAHDENRAVETVLGWGRRERRTYKKNLVTRSVLYIHPALCGDFFVAREQS